VLIATRLHAQINQTGACPHNQNESESDMDNYTATGLAEGFIEAESEEQVLEAWQHLVDTGLAWQLQGFFGRTAASLIEQGYINALQGA